MQTLKYIHLGASRVQVRLVSMETKRPDNKKPYTQAKLEDWLKLHFRKSYYCCDIYYNSYNCCDIL